MPTAQAEEYITQHSSAPLFFPFIVSLLVGVAYCNSYHCWYQIAIANNCKQAIDFTAQLKVCVCGGGQVWMWACVYGAGVCVGQVCVDGGMCGWMWMDVCVHGCGVGVCGCVCVYVEQM